MFTNTILKKLINKNNLADSANNVSSLNNFHLPHFHSVEEKKEHKSEMPPQAIILRANLFSCIGSFDNDGLPLVPDARCKIPSLNSPIKFAGNIRKNPVFDLALIDHYLIGIFHAIVQALVPNTVKVNILQLPESNDPTYVRDHLIFLNDIKKILTTSANKNYSDTLLKTLAPLDYEIIILENTRLMGGDCFYYPAKKIFLYGCHPERDNGDTTRLKEFLAKNDIDLIELRVAPTPFMKAFKEEGRLGCRYLDRKYHVKYYYHLDCFMQPLPNGKVLILNGEILTADSFNTLKRVFGEDNILDLKYSEYNTSGYMFNFIVVENHSSALTLLLPTTPLEVLVKLKQLGFNVITPESIKFGSSEYDKNLTKKVVHEMHKDGFSSELNEENLTTDLHQNIYGYTLHDGVNYTSEIYHQVERTKLSFFAPLSFNPSHGLPETGGPHCSTIEVPVTMLKK